VRTKQDFRARIERRAARTHLQLTTALVEAFDTYLRLLDLWNRKMNLTALRDPDEAVDRLVVEAALAARFVPYEAVALVDVGSGTGSPALPIKICIPRLSVWLVESKARKAAFLREAVRTLALEEVSVETARFEELAARPAYHGAADVMTVRAVRLEAPLVAAAAQVLAPDGQLFLFRSASTSDLSALAPAFRLIGDDALLDHKASRLVRLQRT